MDLVIILAKLLNLVKVSVIKQSQKHTPTHV